MLLRTVHSVLNNSPDDLLHEIILVDDMSTRDYLKDSFGEYIDLLPKTRIIRNTKREGLIVSRMIGSRSTTGTLELSLFFKVFKEISILLVVLWVLQTHLACLELMVQCWLYKNENLSDQVILIIQAFKHLLSFMLALLEAGETHVLF